MERKRRLRSNRPLDQELPQLKDPLGSLPNTCVYDIFEQFTTVELIGMRRVSRGWKDTIDWRLAGMMRKRGLELAEGADEEEATLAFRREIFREQARSLGKPAFVRRFTHATQGFAMCGDYFCWADDTCLNIQRVFKSTKAGAFARVRRYRLTRLLNADYCSIEVIRPQEDGCVTDRPLLLIKCTGGALRAAVVCVKSGSVLWSIAKDEPLYTLQPAGNLMALNHTTLAYLTFGKRDGRPMIEVRDVLTGEVKAAKPIPEEFPVEWTGRTSIQLHPRRDILYITHSKEVFFFSAATASCVGRLSVATFSSANEDSPPRLRFSEHQPKCDPLTREKLFLCRFKVGVPRLLVYCFEYEVPTDEDISVSEARILQNGHQGDVGNLIFKVQRIQIYEQRTRVNRTGPLGLNPMLKQAAQTEIVRVRGRDYTRVTFHSFGEHHPLLTNIFNIFIEPGKRYDGSIPAEFYPPDDRVVLVTKPKRTPVHVRRHNERVDCLIRKPFIAPITLTERYMLLEHQNYIYLFAYEPRW